MKRVSQISAKVATQDLDGVLPVYHTFGNIMGGVYWKPIFNLLEGQFEVILANAQHLKAVPGHKVRREVAEVIAPESNEALKEPAVPPVVPLGGEAGR